MSLELNEKTQIAPPKVIPVSVTLIAKNCAAGLRRCLESLRKNFLRDCDEIVVVDTGSTDDTIKVAEEFGAKVVARPDLKKDVRPQIQAWLPDFATKFADDPQLADGFLMDFAEARQVATDAAAHDIQFWIDSDDVLEEEKPGTLRELINRTMDRMDGIFLNYVYTLDKGDGKPVSILKRERVIDRRRGYWKGKCHETFIPREGVAPRGNAWFADYQGAIIHVGGRADHTFGDMRNYIIIRSEIEADFAAGREPDLRSVFYLANACRGLRRFEECIPLYDKIIAKSGSRDDRYAAAYYLATGFMLPEYGRPLDALDYFFKAMRINPLDPRAYFGIQRAYHLLRRYDESLAFYRMGQVLPEPTQTLHCYDPEHIHTLPHQTAALTAIEINDTKLAEDAVKAIEARRPDHPDTRALATHVKDWWAGMKLAEAADIVATNTRPANQGEYARRLRDVISALPAVPPALEQRGIGKTEPADPRGTGGDDLVFFCGPTAEDWGPRNRITGIGGSEKAVLEMSARLQARGFRVTVYAAVPDAQRGLDDTGVLWRHWSEFDYSRPRGTVIFWRNPAGVLAPLPCQRRIVWCHDVQTPAAWTPEIVAAVDEVWVLSEYHATTLGAARAALGDKLWITRNGIDAALFEAYPYRNAAGRFVAPDGKEHETLPASMQRNPKKVVYCSSPDRGVLTAIRAFQGAGLGDGAELHIFYGFTKTYFSMAAKYEYAHLPDVGESRNYYDYMQEVAKAVDADPRIKWRGRVGPRELCHELSTAGVWLYPTRFPEISCMAAMEAQAAGCALVTTDYAALKETIDWGSTLAHRCRIDSSGFEAPAAALARAARVNDEAERDRLAANARMRFGYDRLADKWAARVRQAVTA